MGGRRTKRRRSKAGWKTSTGRKATRGEEAWKCRKKLCLVMAKIELGEEWKHLSSYSDILIPDILSQILGGSSYYYQLTLGERDVPRKRQEQISAARSNPRWGMAEEGRRRKPSIPEKLSAGEIQQQSFANTSFFIEKEISSIYCPKVLFYSSADWRIPPARLEVYTEKALLRFIAQLPLFFLGKKKKAQRRWRRRRRGRALLLLLLLLLLLPPFPPAFTGGGGGGHN